jgi:long-chain acyl-CoA synthetase
VARKTIELFIIVAASLAGSGFVPPTVSLKRQAIVMPNSKQNGSTAIYRSALSPNKLVDCNPITGAKTLYENFQFAVQHHAQRQCLGHRPKVAGAWATDYHWMTYGEVADRMTSFGSGLLRVYEEYILHPLPQSRNAKQKQFNPEAATGPVPKEHWHLGIYSINRPEWIIAEGACNNYSLVSVALYDTLGPNTLQYIVNHAHLSILVTSADKLINLIRVSEACPSLKVIISMDPLDSEASTYLKLWASEKNLMILTMSEVEDLGRTSILKHQPPSPTDLATICCTT